MSAESFDLITSSDQLESAQLKAGNNKYLKIATNRSVQDSLENNKVFSQGDIEFRFSLSSQSYADFKNSYIEIGTLLTKGNDAEDLLLNADNIAYAPKAASNLFESATLYLNDTEISRVEYQAEVSALKSRQSLSGYRNDTCFEEFAPFATRQAFSEGKKGRTLYYKPPMGLFDNDKLLVAGSYKLVLSPSNQYKKRAVQSTGAAKEPRVSSTVPNDYDFKVVNMNMFVNTIMGPRLDDAQYLIDYNEIQLQPQNLSSSNTQSKAFTVPQSTYGIHIAHQEQSAGTSTLYPPSLFVTAGDKQNTISQFLVQYSNLSYPDSGSLNAELATSDNLSRVYRDTGIVSRNPDPESQDQYASRGAYYSTRMIKDATDFSTNVRLEETFTGGASSVRVLCASQHSKVCEVTVQNGVVVNINVSNS